MESLLFAVGLQKLYHLLDKRFTLTILKSDMKIKQNLFQYKLGFRYLGDTVYMQATKTTRKTPVFSCLCNPFAKSICFRRRV